MSAKKSRAKSTIAYSFKQQLNDLMSVLEASTGHYVRAINPNTQKLPHAFCSSLVKRQLTNNGVQVLEPIHPTEMCSCSRARARTYASFEDAAEPRTLVE